MKKLIYGFGFLTLFTTFAFAEDLAWGNYTITELFIYAGNVHIGLSPNLPGVSNNWHGTHALITSDNKTMIAAILSCWNSGNKVIKTVHYENQGTGDGGPSNQKVIRGFLFVQ